MVTTQIDEVTVQALERQAQNAGMSLVEYPRSLVAASATRPRANWDQIESEIVELSSSGPSLPRRLFAR